MQLLMVDNDALAAMAARAPMMGAGSAGIRTRQHLMNWLMAPHKVANEQKDRQDDQEKAGRLLHAHFILKDHFLKRISGGSPRIQLAPRHRNEGRMYQNQPILSMAAGPM